MQRVVLTSSIRAVFGFGSEKPADYLYTEGDWNTSSTLENNQAYALSKTLAEVRAACCVRRATDGRKGRGLGHAIMAHTTAPSTYLPIPAVCL